MDAGAVCRESCTYSSEGEVSCGNTGIDSNHREKVRPLAAHLNEVSRIPSPLGRGVCQYVQFAISADNNVNTAPAGKTVGLDVGLKEFYTDSDGHTEPNPKFYRISEKRLKFRQRRVSRKKKGSANRKKAINRLGRSHLKISRQRGAIRCWENLGIQSVNILTSQSLPRLAKLSVG